MCLVIDLREMLKIQKGVVVGGADVDVPEQFLHSGEIGGRLDPRQ